MRPHYLGMRPHYLAKLGKTVILSVNEESSRYFATLRYAQYDNQVIVRFARGLTNF